jgi:hypothetical protein
MGGLQHTTIVAGIIHNITLSISQASANVTLRAYFSGSIIIANNTNNYSWSYSSGVWADDLYGYYIKNESARYGTAYCFNIALDSTAWVGNWRFVTIVNGTEVSNNIIMVERQDYPCLLPHSVSRLCRMEPVSLAPGNPTMLSTPPL